MTEKRDDRPLVSLFKNLYSGEAETVPLPDIMNGIQSGRWAKEINCVRSLQSEAEQKKAKENLPCFTVTGVFSGRKSEDIVSFSNRIPLDFDEKDNPGIEAFRQEVTNDQYCEYVFTSCRGKGFAVICIIDGAEHEASFEYLQKHFKDTYGLEVDASGGNINRQRFVSHDPLLFKRNSKTEKVDLTFHKLVKEYGKPYYFSTKPGESDKVSALNESFWAALHAQESIELYDPDEQEFNRYEEINGLYRIVTPSVIKQETSRRILEMSRVDNVPSLEEKRKDSHLTSIISQLKGIIEKRGAFPKISRRFKKYPFSQWDGSFPERRHNF